VRTQEELLPFNETHSLRLHPDVLQFLFAMGADGPYVIWGFLNIKFASHIFLLANVRGVAARVNGYEDEKKLRRCSRLPPPPCSPVFFLLRRAASIRA
jgi:hypothetical protein